MTENDQIEAMAKVIDDIQCVNMPIEVCRAETRLGNSCAVCEAKRLYAKGYRKASEVAREIFAEIEEVLNHLGYFDEIDFNSLKKKYGGATDEKI